MSRHHEIVFSTLNVLIVPQKDLFLGMRDPGLLKDLLLDAQYGTIIRGQTFAHFISLCEEFFPMLKDDETLDTMEFLLHNWKGQSSAVLEGYVSLLEAGINLPLDDFAQREWNRLKLNVHNILMAAQRSEVSIHDLYVRFS